MLVDIRMGRIAGGTGGTVARNPDDDSGCSARYDYYRACTRNDDNSNNNNSSEGPDSKNTPPVDSRAGWPRLNDDIRYWRR